MVVGFDQTPILWFVCAIGMGGVFVPCGWFVLGLLAVTVSLLGCRWRLIVDARGGRIWRTWLGIPYWRHDLGRGGRVALRDCWSADEIVIVRDQEDVDEGLVFGEVTGLDDHAAFCALAAEVNDAIDRVTASARPRTAYRSAPEPADSDSDQGRAASRWLAPDWAAPTVPRPPHETR